MYNTLQSIHQSIENQEIEPITIKRQAIPFFTILIGLPILLPLFIFMCITIIMFPFACLFGWL